jgi:hypothetical protein
MYTVIKLTNEHIPLIEQFCQECDRVGYENNASIEKMKFGTEYDLRDVPNFWGVVMGTKLISVSGSHYWRGSLGPLDGIKYQMRCLFRSATLPEHDNVVRGLSKNHMNSLPFSVMLPHQIEYGITNGAKHFYITTSTGDHDASGKMKRTHRALELLERTGLVKYAGDAIIYSTYQTKWELHIDMYLSALRKFHPARLAAGIEPNEEYLRIIENGFSMPWEGFCNPPNDDLDI